MHIQMRMCMHMEPPGAAERDAQAVACVEPAPTSAIAAGHGFTHDMGSVNGASAFGAREVAGAAASSRAGVNGSSGSGGSAGDERIDALRVKWEPPQAIGMHADVSDAHALTTRVGIKRKPNEVGSIETMPPRSEMMMVPTSDGIIPNQMSSPPIPMPE